MESIYIFGIGNFYKSCEKMILRQYEIEAYLDNDERKWKEQICGRPVWNPNRIQGLKGISVLIMTKKFVNIFYQLVDLGVKPENIHIGISIFPETEQEKMLVKYGTLKFKNNQLTYHSDLGDTAVEKEKDIELLFKNVLRRFYRENMPDVLRISQLSDRPVSRDWGMGRGSAVDRVYIEKFLVENKQDIRGKVLEIANNQYTLKYGETRVKESKVLHVKGWHGAIKGNLETGEGLEGEIFDTIILTQTLMFIFDLRRVVENLYNILSENGIALITVSGISQISRYDADNWGSFWGFHKDALENLFIPRFGKENVEVQSYGNVKAAVAMLYGLCAEEIEPELFQKQDPDYPIILTVRVQKKTVCQKEAAGIE